MKSLFPSISINHSLCLYLYLYQSISFSLCINPSRPLSINICISINQSTSLSLSLSLSIHLSIYISINTICVSVSTKNTNTKRASYLQEIKSTSVLGSHENIVQYYNAWQNEGHFFVLMEFCHCNLNEVLLHTNIVSEPFVWKCIVHLSKVLYHSYVYIYCSVCLYLFVSLSRSLFLGLSFPLSGFLPLCFSLCLCIDITIIASKHCQLTLPFVFNRDYNTSMLVMCFI